MSRSLPPVAAALVFAAAFVVAQEFPVMRTPPRPTASVPTLALRAATAGLVVVGKVVSIEADEVEAAVYNGSSQKASYRVAVVKIEDGLTDTAGQTHVKIGFQPTGVYSRPGAAAFEMKPDAVGLFILGKHHSGAFYTPATNSPPIDAGAKTYKDDLAQVKKALAAVADPVKALKAGDAKERYFAAAVLVERYRTSLPGQSSKTEATPAEESKLILQALADADWADPEKGVPTPQQTLARLGLGPKDKWQPAAVPAGVNAATHLRDEFKKWLAGDGAKYQVPRYAAK